MKLTKEEKNSLIEQIISIVEGSYQHRKFAADCIREVVSKWNDQKILDWFNSEKP